jgi:REP element-mobilizing transposase RayT
MQIHNRLSIRLQHHDYASNGMYYITICVYNHQNVFGRIENGKMITSPFGQIANEQWFELPKRFPYVQLDAFIVMPKHVHGVLLMDYCNSPGIIETYVGAGFTPALDNNNIPTQNNKATARLAPTTIPNIIGAYKSLVLQHALQYIKTNCPDTILGKLWQRGYYDHIIRDYQAYEKITDYIANNPVKWDDDKFFIRKDS